MILTSILRVGDQATVLPQAPTRLTPHDVGRRWHLNLSRNPPSSVCRADLALSLSLIALVILMSR